ncbi:MAG: PDZ domain-containing protein [Candidatus Latescibacteria bacterium]|nr:PDZ domain-containing protein [Candidatus Latescibacterota bacterium]
MIRFTALFAIVLGYCLGLADPARGTTETDPYAEINASWDRLGAVYTRILESYHADLDQSAIMKAAIEGMLEELDAYSQFFDEEGLLQLQQDTSGKFAGLGITVAIKDHHPVIISPMEDTPADRAGLLPGDQIVAVEGRQTYDFSLEEVVQALRGEPGSEVRITVSRQGAPNTWDVVIERELIKIKSVSLAEELHPGIGYIGMRRTRFSENTSQEVNEALSDLQQQGVKGLILDLRGNPGGLLSQATEVADLFLPKGVPIVSIRERTGANSEIRYSQQEPVSRILPLVVLIDEGSASASEIVAGAIQDNDRGVILGTASFGKGSVQTIFDLYEAENSALKLTTAHYYTPSGRSIHRENRNFSRGVFIPSPLGQTKLPADWLFDTILHSATYDQAAAAVQARFNLDAGEVDQILSMDLSALVGLASASSQGESTDNDHEVFYTSNKRKVYGSGGITPDILVEAVELPLYVQEVERKRLFFNFMIEYMAGDSSRVEGITEDTPVDAETLEAFSYFLKERMSEGRAGRKELAQMRQLAKDMDWGAEVQGLVDSLEAIIERNQPKGFSPQVESYMRNGLKREQALRLWGRQASLRVALKEDPQMRAAILLLQDDSRYSQLLGQGAS